MSGTPSTAAASDGMVAIGLTSLTGSNSETAKPLPMPFLLTSVESASQASMASPSDGVAFNGGAAFDGAVVDGSNAAMERLCFVGGAVADWTSTPVVCIAGFGAETPDSFTAEWPVTEAMTTGATLTVFEFCSTNGSGLTVSAAFAFTGSGDVTAFGTASVQAANRLAMSATTLPQALSFPLPQCVEAAR